MGVQSSAGGGGCEVGVTGYFQWVLQVFSRDFFPDCFTDFSGGGAQFFSGVGGSGLFSVVEFF